MNVVRWFREEIQNGGLGRLGWAINEEFDNLVTRIQAGWSRQHGTQGQHTNVTATTVAVDSVLRTGRLAISSPFPPALVHPSRMTVTLLNAGSPYHDLAVPASVGFLRVVTDSGCTITGISSAGREVGDLLIVANQAITTGVGVSLNLWNLNSQRQNRFQAQHNTPGTINVTLDPGRWIWLILDGEDFNNEVTSRFWRVHQL